MITIPYGRQWIDEDDISAVSAVLRGDFLTQGPATQAFEQKICDLTGARYCLSVANGTAALHLAVATLALEEGGEGITTTNTFVASAHALVYSGLKPVLADIDPKTYCMFPEDLAKRLTKNTRAVIPVHFAGQPCDMRAIRAACGEGVRIIEDAAHAIGTRYAEGDRVGSCRYSDMTVFSFHPVKTITSGEGGAITTNDRALFERLKSLRICGVVRDVPNAPGPWYYEVQSLGYNYRLTDVHCALGLSQLAKLDRFVERRRWIVAEYNKAFASLPFLQTPYERPGVHSAFHLYVGLIDFKKVGKTRKQVMAELADEGIGTQVHYIPVHEQPFYRQRFGYRHGDLPNSEAYYEMALSLPLYPKMSDADVAHVTTQVKRVLS